MANYLRKITTWLKANVARMRDVKPFTLAFTLLGTLLFSAMIVYVIYSLYREGSTLLTQLVHINLWAIVISFLIYSWALALAMLVWVMMMSRITGNKDIKRHIQVYCYTNLARRVPGPLLHIVGRAYLYKRDNVGLIAVSAVSALEFLLLLLSGLMASSLLSLGNWSARWGLGAIVGMVIGLILLHPRNLRWTLQKLGQEQLNYTLRYRDILLWLGLYILIWFAGGLTLSSTVLAVMPLDFSQVIGIASAWSLSGVVATLVVFLPSGLGLREMTLSAALLPFMSSPLAVTIALLIRVLLTLYEMIWAFFAIWL